MATIHRIYTFYSTDCRMYTFYNSPIECIHSTSLAIECIHSITFYILYNICTNCILWTLPDNKIYLIFSYLMSGNCSWVHMGYVQAGCRHVPRTWYPMKSFLAVFRDNICQFVIISPRRQKAKYFLCKYLSFFEVTGHKAVKCYVWL